MPQFVIPAEQFARTMGRYHIAFRVIAIGAPLVVVSAFIARTPLQLPAQTIILITAVALLVACIGLPIVYDLPKQKELAWHEVVGEISYLHNTDEDGRVLPANAEPQRLLVGIYDEGFTLVDYDKRVADELFNAFVDDRPVCLVRRRPSKRSLDYEGYLKLRL